MSLFGVTFSVSLPVLRLADGGSAEFPSPLFTVKRVKQ